MTLASVAGAIDRARRQTPAYRSLLVAVSGIDGCGKGYVAACLSGMLEAQEYRVATINVDAWLNLPRVRFSDTHPAEHFYRHAIRFEDMFATLVRPLRDRRAIHVEANVVRETDVDYRRQLYEFVDIDVILLEGIFLLKRAYQTEYDLSVWIECGFERALERAVGRAQEGLPPEKTIAAYRRIYFPAQVIHAERDRPSAAASCAVRNDV